MAASAYRVPAPRSAIAPPATMRPSSIATAPSGIGGPETGSTQSAERTATEGLVVLLGAGADGLLVFFLDGSGSQLGRLLPVLELCVLVVAGDGLLELAHALAD